jgi:hypothetical protein
MKKRTQVTIHTRQRVLVQAVRVRCQQCGAEVPIITPENAAGVLQKTPTEITRLIAAGELHAVEESSGSNVICVNSLPIANELEAEPDNNDLF